MPNRSGFSIASNIVSFIVSFMYRLTVQLAVEFLKFIFLLAILTVSCGVCGVGFVSLVVWAYVAFDSSLVAAVGGAGFGIVIFVLAAVAVQYVVKDVLKLTDKPLLHLVKIYLVASIGRGGRQPAEEMAKGQAETEEPSTTHVYRKDKKDV